MYIRIIMAIFLLFCLVIAPVWTSAFDGEEDLSPKEKELMLKREQKLAGELEICGDVVADLGVDNSTRFVLLNEEGEYYPYLYQSSKDFTDNCGQLGSYICAKAKKQLEIPDALNKMGIRAV